MVLKDHDDLVKLLLRVKGKVVLSGYPHEVYDRLEQKGWERIDREWVVSGAVMTKTKDATRRRVVESLWFSPNMAVGSVFDGTETNA